MLGRASTLSASSTFEQARRRLVKFTNDTQMYAPGALTNLRLWKKNESPA